MHRILTLKRKLFVSMVILLVSILLLSCASDPIADLYTENLFPGTTGSYDIGSLANPYNDGYFDNLFVGGVPVAAGGNVNAAANLDDNAVVRGDGGVYGVQDSLVSINDFGTLNAPAITTGNLASTGKVEADRLIGDIEGYSIDVVQSSDSNIILNDTLDLVFLFVPDIITINYSGRCQHDVTLDDGHTTGRSVVSITGVDTMTSNTNYTALINNGGAFGSRIGQNDAVNAVVVYGGNDGVDDSYFYGVGSWTTATKTLTLTFSSMVNNNTATNYIEILAVAYR